MATYTAAQAAELCQVSVRTIQRKTAELEAAGAWKDSTGQWHLTTDVLRAVGLSPGRPAAPEPPTAEHDKPAGQPDIDGDTLSGVQADRDHWRQRAQLAEAINTERERTIQTQATALRIIEATPPTPPPLRRRWWRKNEPT